MSDKIRNWRKRENSIKESVWLSEGIDIYRKLLDDDPGNMDYKVNLGKLLIRSGTDEKLKYVNMVTAKNLFQQVVQLFPENTEALYRLGHISYENHKLEDCINYFTQAIDISLSGVRLFRAYTTLSKTYFHLGDDAKSQHYLQKAIELDQERNFTNEINEVQSLVTQNGRFKKLVRYSDGTTLFLTLEEVKRLKCETDANEEAELDVTHFHPTFTGPKGERKLERKEAEILCYLIENDNRYVSKEELLKKLWEEGESPKPKTIPAYISKINRKTKNCLPEEMKQIISTKRGLGYRWTCSVPTKIIKQI